MSEQSEGTRISHYRVTGELGRDGLGAVLSAVDERLDRPVALKVVRAVDAFPGEVVEGARRRFTRDAQRAARVIHPNVATIYGYEQIGAADVLAMELVEGETLEAMLASGERWRTLDAAALVARIADGVAAAHARRLVHGHIRLRNVKVTPDDRVKILDLGVPKASGAELAAYVTRAGGGDAALPAEPTYEADVAALARIACNLITGALRPVADGLASQAGAPRQPVFPDPARVLPNLGVLAPVVARALTPVPGAGFADAGAFRDALLAVLEAARRPAGEAQPPADLDAAARSSSGARGSAILEAEGRLTTLDGFSSETKRPALVLPADLAAHTEPLRPGTYVVMGEGRPLEWLHQAGAHWIGRLPRPRRTHLLAAAVMVLLLSTVTFAALRLRSKGASAVILASGGDGIAAGPPPAVSPPPVAPGSLPGLGAASGGERQAGELPTPAAVVEEVIASLDSAAADLPPVRTGRVTAGPAGTAITLVGGEGGPWLDAAELSVKQDDSLVLRFVRPGYVARTAVFRGESLAIALRPDSVTVRLAANVPAEVYLLGNGGDPPQRLGTTELTVRLPTGAHRFVFRAEHQDDWVVARPFETAGEAYTLEKTDYATAGDLVATVAGGWGWVSLDGGEEHETPHRFSDLNLGPHVLQLRRDGFRTVVDTVDVRGGQAITRQYTLQRTP